MRVDNHIHLRHIMLYHFEKGWSAAESFRDLKELFGQGTIGRATVYEWFDRFKSGNTSVDDEPGRGRPSEFDDKALLEAVEEDESLTTRMLADEFNVDQSTIVRHLREFVWDPSSQFPYFAKLFYITCYDAGEQMNGDVYTEERGFYKFFYIPSIITRYEWDIIVFEILLYVFFLFVSYVCYKFARFHSYLGTSVYHQE